MMIDRRSFFATLLAPIIARLIPRNTLLDTIDDGINPDWDGTFRAARTPVLDEINAITLRVLRENPILDNVFTQSPFSALMMRRERILDAGGRIIGQFGRMPGGPWERLGGGLIYPATAPRLPA